MSINQDIIEFGKEIFLEIENKQKKIKNFDSINKLIQLAIKNPQLKINLFKLVDVLPTLKDTKSVSKHIKEYLEDVSLFSTGGKLADLSPFRGISSIILKQSVKAMAQKFIAGENPKSALKNIKEVHNSGLATTIDLLGEYSLSEDEAKNYLNRYLEAIKVLSKESNEVQIDPSLKRHPGLIQKTNISIKLSALYSQASTLNYKNSVDILTSRLKQILEVALSSNTNIYLDAEDLEKNTIIYEVFMKVFSEEPFKKIDYPGIVLQAYQKDSEILLDELISFAKKRGSPISIRLVKGAYWDSETAKAIKNNWEPKLFADKTDSDANFEKLSRKLLKNHNYCLPAFGSHNVRSLAHACVYAKKLGLSKRDFEIQMLYGMADSLPDIFKTLGFLVRLYIPIGKTLPGMSYLVRRLLENTSNESFLRQSLYQKHEIEDLLRQPYFRS